MPSHNPRSDAAGPHGDDDRSRRDGADGLARRAFLRRTAGVSAGAVGVGAVGVGSARAQEGTGTDTGTATGTEAGEEEETIATKGAVPADAPKLGNPDFVGLLLHVAGVNQDASTRNVSGCPFVDSDDAVVAYDVTFIHRDRVDPEPENGRQADGLLFSAVNNDTVAYGKLFIVTGQESCGSGHVQVQLEEVGAANIRTGTPNVGVNDGAGAVTETALPGFGVGATLAGLLGGGALLRRRR